MTNRVPYATQRPTPLPDVVTVPPGRSQAGWVAFRGPKKPGTPISLYMNARAEWRLACCKDVP